MDIDSPSQAFCEIPHSADIAIEVIGETLNELFIHAADGLCHAMDLEISPNQTVEKEMKITECDIESLLVAFLSELIYEAEKGTCFRVIEMVAGENELHAKLTGFPIIRQKREIKAATYHNLSIQFDGKKWHTQIIFDV